MKKSLLLLSLLSTTYLVSKEAAPDAKTFSSKDITEHSQKWAKQVTQKLNAEELQLLANYLYFNFLTIRYDHLMRVAFIACQNELSTIQFLVNSRPDDVKKNANDIGKQLLFVTEQAMPLKIYAIKSAQACFEHIEDSESTALKKVITNFQNYSTSAVNQFIQQDWPRSITKLFRTCAENMKKESEKLMDCQANLHEKASLDIDDEQDPEFYGNNFQEAITSADTSYASYLTLLSHTLNVKSMSADILNISAIIHNIFYNSLLETLKSQKKMSCCSIMFDENGLIDEEDQDEILVTLNEKYTVDKRHFKKTQE